MDIATNYVVSISPPTYQQGTEEARKDTLARTQIPEPNKSQNSAAQSRTANEYGNTQGANSQLAAQVQGFIQAKTDINKDSVELKKSEKETSKNTGKEGKAKGKSQGQSEVQTNTQANTAKLDRKSLQESFASLAKLAGASSATITEAISANLGAQAHVATTSQQSTNEKKAQRKESEQKSHFIGAKYAKDIADKNGNYGVIARAINKRYNSTLPSNKLGRNLNISA